MTKQNFTVIAVILAAEFAMLAMFANSQSASVTAHGRGLQEICHDEVMYLVNEKGGMTAKFTKAGEISLCEST